MTVRHMTEFEVPRGDEDKFVFHEWLCVYAALLRGARDETYGDLAIEQKLDNRVGIGAMDRKLEPWMLREKNGEEPRKHGTFMIARTVYVDT